MNRVDELSNIFFKTVNEFLHIFDKFKKNNCKDVWKYSFTSNLLSSEVNSRVLVIKRENILISYWINSFNLLSEDSFISENIKEI